MKENDQRASEDAPLAIEVEGPLGRHRAVLPVVEDGVDRVSGFFVPLMWAHSTTTCGSTVKFLDPGVTLGFDCRSYYSDSPTREPVETFSLDVLPFGMFRVKSFPESGVDEVTLFWFLTF